MTYAEEAVQKVKDESKPEVAALEQEYLDLMRQIKPLLDRRAEIERRITMFENGVHPDAIYMGWNDDKQIPIWGFPVKCDVVRR